MIGNWMSIRMRSGRCFAIAVSACSVGASISRMILAALVTLTGGTIVTANALDFGVGPNGVYIGPNRHHYYDEYGENWRVIITHRTNRFDEDVEVRRRVCD